MAEAGLLSAEQALAALDENWYTRAKLSSKRRDMLGAFVGTELFFLEGDSLIQRVLNDPLIALGQDGDCSLQLLHAYYAFEKIITDFAERGANFQIVFFENSRHLTIGTGALSSREIAVRSLIRTILVGHALRLLPTTCVFSSPSDPMYTECIHIQKPMLLCMSDGGMLQDHPGSSCADSILIQRGLLRDALAHHLAIGLLDAVEFKDSKIMTFVYESRRGSGAYGRQKESHPSIPSGVWGSMAAAEYRLAELENQIHCPSDFAVPGDRDAWLVQAAQAYLQHVDAGDPPSQPVLHAFLAHIVLLTSLDVMDRSLGPCVLDPALTNYVRTKFYPTIFPFLGAHLSEVTFRPDLDGRVFEHLLHAIVEGHELSTLLGPLAAAELDAIWTNLGQGASVYTPLSAQFSPVKAQNSETQVARPPRLLPLANDVVADILRDIDSTTEIGNDRDDEAGTQSSGIPTFLLRDTHVWPKGRSTVPSHHTGPHVPKPATERLRQRKLRNDQRFMKQLQRQAETLTGAKGARLQQQVIAPVSVSKHSSNKPREKAPLQPKSGAKKGQVPLKSADKLRQQIKQAKEVKVQSEAEAWWKAQLAEISKLIPTAQITHLDGLKRNKKADELWLAAEIAVYRLHLVCTQWIADDNREDPETSDRYRVSLLAQIRDLSTMEGLTSTIRGTMSSILQTIGFSKLELPNNAAADVADRAYQFKFVKIMSKSKGTPLFSFFPIQEHPTEHQLRQFGEYMDRSMDSQPDPRTQFDPDAWQRQVLDKIDQEESILVVAPTSAGKTFIGFYAMERVLRESDSGILIYVAPTKALVTQIAAEVYARFKKDLGGKSCWAVHTRELQLHNPAETQILITIPEMLSNMLLTPALARVWTPRIRRIIFDEIHSISEAEGGAVWEQLILMAPCPIIGLSATVGNPHDFNRWLESVQKAHGYKHTLILHPHRYSHLRKFVWNARAGPSSVFTGLAKKIPGNRLVFIHPISALGFRAQEIPSDLSLESRDCLSLYRAMKACAEPEQQNELVPLDPIVFFEERSTWFFRQKDVLEYEEALKSKLQSWMSNPGGRKPGSPARHAIASLSEEIQSAPSDFWMDRNERSEDLVKLLSDLHHQDDLPAILFSFDRYNSETLAKALLAKLEEAEAAYRETSPIWKQKMQEWERWQAGAKAREKDAARGKKKPTRKGSGDEDGDAEPERGSSAPAPPSLTNPDDPTPDFTFTSFKGYTREELAQDLDQLSWKGVAPWLMDCLKRGIAVHHSGMNKAYRSLIEGLFRIGFIRVMIASETLALGINAPARTTVFLGDSPELTALMYRQCAGRAGRRGFDLLGKVVFFGVPLDKIQRLMLSRLPPLTGQFPLSTTLSLRLFNVLDGSDNAPAARDAVRGILGLARLSVSSKTGEAEMRHHFRFSVDYLRRSKLLDEAGKTLLLTNLAAPLHENEPGNLALVALLRAGYFHQLSANLDSNRQQTPREFVLVLSHLFSRRYMRRISSAEVKELIGNAASVVVLPPLPQEAKRVLESHNQRILKIFSSYTVAYAKRSSMVLDVDRSLPLSGELPKPVTASQDIPIVELLRRHTVPVISRSAFVANSGHGDNFASIEDLDRTTRPGLHLNKSVIPYIQLASESAPFSLNALLYDFFVHGSDDTLVMINGIGRGEVWYILNDFFLVLVQVQTSIEQLFRQAIKDASTDTEGDTFEPPSLDDDLEDRREYFSSKEGVQGVSEAFPQRPPSIPEADWDVYRMVAAVRGEFEAKFKAMWA